MSLEIWITYPDYANILKWLALALLAYVATALMVANDWERYFSDTSFRISNSTSPFSSSSLAFSARRFPLICFSGRRLRRLRKKRRSPRATARRAGTAAAFHQNIRIDTTIGMFSSQLVQWFIIITTGTVLFAHGVKNINTAADAAAALEPLVHSFPNSGQFARDIFAFGVDGLGSLRSRFLRARPLTLWPRRWAGSKACRKFGEAQGFYGIIMVSTLVGLA